MVQVFRREMLGEELLIDMDFAWTGSQKFQLQVWLISSLTGMHTQSSGEAEEHTMSLLIHQRFTAPLPRTRVLGTPAAPTS